MAAAEKDINKYIEQLITATDSILNGEYNQWDTEVDAEGMLSVLAQKINALVINMRSVETPLTSAGEHAPSAVMSAKSVIELMAQATGQVLDSADQLTFEVDHLEKTVADLPPAELTQKMTELKAHLFDIIASQSYQDVARQKMEALINDLGQMRDWLVEVLVILNIQKNGSPENVEQKAKLLREVNEAATTEEMKQDLVDDLLAEFGF
jgi:chemotaxis protein CheZ